MQQELPESIASRYRVLGLLGAGGIGVVYQAFDPVLDKTVAVKVLLHLSDDLKVRFHQEAKTAGKLKHRNIISVLDFGLTKEQQPYMVMECVDGKTLSSTLAGGTGMALADAVGIFLQICDGLEHAHKNGVLHRDIKPGNIMLTDIDGEEPRAIIVDFGLAKLWSTDQSMTASGQMMGSPFYISPEQIKAGEVDARTDIYSLGCLMFEVLTGSPPFRGQSVQETMTMHISSPIPSLASVSGEAFEPELEEILSRCLAKNKEDRFESAAALRTALIEFCSRSENVDTEAVLLSTQVPPLTKTPEALKLVSKKMILPLVALSGLVGCLAIYISTRQTSQESMTTFDKLVDDNLKSIGKLSSLEELDLNECYGFSNESLRYLTNNKKLRNLNLEGYMGLDDEGLKSITEMKSLNVLNIDRTYDYHGSAFALLSKLKNLETLVMSFQGTTPAEAKERYEVLNKITSDRMPICGQASTNGIVACS